jgi:hypothetical protein
MFDDEFFSDDDDHSDDSFSGIENNNNNENHNSSNDFFKFENVYKKKQVETLRFLRATLNENKILKRRLNLIENELERYQEFEAMLPLTDKPRLNSATSNERYIFSTCEDKECQVELIFINGNNNDINSGNKISNNNELVINESSRIIKTPIRNESVEQIKLNTRSESENLSDEASRNDLKSTIISEEKSQQRQQSSRTLNETPVKNDTQFTNHKIIEMKEKEINDDENELVMVDKACQCDDLFISRQSPDHNNDDASENDEYKADKEEEIKNLNQTIFQLKVNNKQLMEKYNAVMKSHEMTNILLSESKFEYTKLKEENKQLDELKLKINVLSTENEQLQQEIMNFETQLNSKKNELEQLNETVTLLNENFVIIDRQREKIEFLEAENEKYLNEKHISCEQKIAELTNECQANVDFIQTQKIELEKLNNLVFDLNQQLEKNKLEMKSFNFKEFISLRRELAQLKQEREKQFANEVTNQPIGSMQQTNPLPPIKEKKPFFKFFH